MQITIKTVISIVFGKCLQYTNLWLYFRTVCLLDILKKSILVSISYDITGNIIITGIKLTLPNAYILIHLLFVYFIRLS